MEKFTITPNGINHNESPVFVAGWNSGEEAEAMKTEAEGFFSEGSGELDQLLISPIEWQDGTPQPEQFTALMSEAVTALDNWIAERF